MEAIFFLLEQKKLEWNTIRKEINNGNFLFEMLQLEAMKVKNKTISTIENQYMKDEHWDLEKIKLASRAVSPLVDWLVYELIYIKMQKKIMPKQKEIEEKSK